MINQSGKCVKGPRKGVVFHGDCDGGEGATEVRQRLGRAERHSRSQRGVMVAASQSSGTGPAKPPRLWG